MNTVLVDNVDNRAVADSEAKASRRRATSRCGLGMSNISHWVRRQLGYRPAKPQFGARRMGAFLLAAASMAVFAATVFPQTFGPHDPPVTTLMTNMLQPAGGDHQIVNLNDNQTGLLQWFRTGPREGGYQLTSIWLYVRRTHESRYMTINASLYRGDPGGQTWVAPLTRGQLNDFAHNEWQAPANTYLKPNTDYYFVLDCAIAVPTSEAGQNGFRRVYVTA